MYWMAMARLGYDFYYVPLLCFILSVICFFWMVAWLVMLAVEIEMSGLFFTLCLILVSPLQGDYTSIHMIWNHEKLETKTYGFRWIATQRETVILSNYIEMTH
jgi:hypothetical protein